MMTGRQILTLIGAAVAVACTDATVGPAPGTPGLEIVAGPSPADTIEATPVQALVVELRDLAGKIIVGSVVRFTPMAVDTAPFYSSMQVAPPAGRDFGDFAADTTNASGRATALVRFGFIAGPGRIRVVAPELGAERVVTYSIRPGQPVRIRVTPADTTVYPSGGLQLRGQALDRAGNVRAESATFAAGPSQAQLLSVSSTGAVTAGSGFGRATVTASLGTLRDSSVVTVVPRGVFAAVDVGGNGGLVVGNLDGSGQRRYPLPGTLDYGIVDPAWAPDGSGIAFVDQTNRIAILNTDGAVNPLIAASVPDLGVQFSPVFSPDGRTVYFSGGSFLTGNRTIWRVGRDGSGARSISQALTGGDFSPSVEPAGQVAAFHTPEARIRFVNLQSGLPVGTSIPGLYPEYSRTQDRLSLVTGEQVAIVNVDGGGFRIVTPIGRRYAQLVASWAPNGDWLLVRGESLLELIQVATGLRLVLPWSVTLTHPAWKPGS